MPVATVSTEPERHELKSLPGEGDAQGFVLVRPLPYGMVLDRRDKGTRMSMEQETQRGRKRSRRQNEPETTKIELETLSSWINQHDFAYCIVDHNLQDKNGAKLDFANPMTIKALDPKVGAEIERILSDLNEIEEDEEEDFTTLLTSSSPNETAHLKEVTTTPDS